MAAICRPGVVAYLTGGGPVNPAGPLAAGGPAPNGASSAALPYSISVGGQPATQYYLGLTPGFVGLYQANFGSALSPKVMASPPGIRLAYRQLLGRVAAIPGVRSAAITSLVPLGVEDVEIPFWPGGGPQPAQDRTTSAMFSIVTPDYPGAMHIPLLRGRFFTGSGQSGFASGGGDSTRSWQGTSLGIGTWVWLLWDDAPMAGM
jgi:hypothetical protein